MPNAKRNLEKLVKEAQAKGPPRSAEELEAGFKLWWRHLYSPVAWCQEALKFRPDTWQGGFITCRDQQIIVNVSRQAGKTTTAAAKVLHRALFFPGSVILLVAPAVPQATEFRVRLDEHLRVLEYQIETKEDNKRTLIFKNRSRIIIVAADRDTTRGYTPHMIIEDEADRKSVV